jgi:nucleotidyltransferase substrate binding protein (TIGR01987 family)
MVKTDSLLEDLEKSVARLEEAASLDSTVIHQDATIQRFEFTFELAWKLMQEIGKESNRDMYGPRNSIREAAQLGLIDDPQVWFDFLEARNLTVHTYNEETAQKVYKKAKEFVPHAKSLLKQFKNYLMDN